MGVETLKNVKVTFDSPINTGLSFEYDQPRDGLIAFPAWADYTSHDEADDENTYITYYKGYPVYISKTKTANGSLEFS